MNKELLFDDDIVFFHNQYYKSSVWKKMTKQMPEKGIFPSLRGESVEGVNFDEYIIHMKKLDVEDQYSSGRCWIYATCHFLRQEYYKKYQTDLLLSQEYLAFYDLLEKSNCFINYITDHISDSIEDRIFLKLLTHPIQDAGQWDYIVNILDKYGVAPQNYMMKNSQSKNTGDMIAVLSNMLRITASNIKKEYVLKNKKADFNFIKKNEMSKIYSFLCAAMGEPPESIEIYVGSDAQQKEKMTPREFYHTFFPSERIKTMIPITSLSGLEMQADHAYEIEGLKNMVEGRSVRYLNLGRREFKRLILDQLQHNMPVWFGCDSRYGVDKKKGVLDLNFYDMNQIGIQLPDREESLLYHISELTHAMLFEGVRFDSKGRLSGWLVKNSYGPEKGNNGYLDMKDRWFDQYVYEAVIDRSLLSADQIRIYKSDSVLLPRWHPIGTLAD